MPPVINPRFPIHAIGSVEELMAIAAGMEREAARRYEQLADAMDQRDEPDLAATFRQLAEMEREHEAGIGRWAAREGRAAPIAASFSWRLPETFDDEALTPYRALGIAVRNEERAFAFYSYLSALAADAATQARAEALAREELKHVSLLRRLRRQAYHRHRPPPGPPEPPRRAATLAEWESLTAGLEHGSRAIDGLAAAALDAEGDGRSAALLRHHADPPPQMPPTGALTADGALRLALRDAEEAAEFHMTTAEQATDEDLLRHAQERAEHAVARIAVIRTLIQNRKRRD